MTRKKRVARTYFLRALWIQDPSPSKFHPYNGENLMYHFCKLAMCYYSYLKSIKGCAFESIPVLWKVLQIFARVEDRGEKHVICVAMPGHFERVPFAKLSNKGQVSLNHK